MAMRNATAVMIELLEAALKTSHKARYVLFDTWFANPHQIIQNKYMGLDTIAMVRKGAKIKYEFDGKRLNIKEIYSNCKKLIERSRYLLSIEVKLGKDNGDEHQIPARIVCVRNRNKKNDGIALITTDMDLSEEEIIHIYGDIDVFFKTCRTYLKLRKECRSLSYDAMTAHVAIVFTRHMILSVFQQHDENQPALGELFSDYDGTCGHHIQRIDDVSG